MAPPSSDQRPVLRLHQPPFEVERFARVFEAAERLGQYDLRVSMSDQLYVRSRLAEMEARLPTDERAGFAGRADLVIELAFYAGIAVALAHAERTPDEIGNAIARAQEWSA